MKTYVFCLLLLVSPLIWDAYSSTAVRKNPPSQPMMVIHVRHSVAASGAIKPGQPLYLNSD